MKLSVDMLKQYVDIPVEMDEYESRMIMAGTAVEGVENLSKELSGVVVGRVVTCEEVEGTHLHKCTVDVRGEAPLQIVCGAPNVKVGVLVPVATEGAKLPGGIKIKRGKLRGIESCGMLCSGPEIGVPKELYPNIGDEGLLIFHEDYPLGSDVRPILGIDDVVVDFEILANRPDTLCALGIARETAATLGTEFHAPVVTVTEAGGDIHSEVKVEVMDDQLCPRYMARVVKNVRIGQSPLWLRKYLNGAGIRSINNIVDITNYVMIEYGHPMHAFDLNKVRGKHIIVRRAKDAEKLTTLDGVEHTLSSGDLVICDEERATGLAGIMGGEESEITENTKTVMFECASFDRTAIRLTGRAQGMRTESSGRFERGVSPATVGQAMQRACQLVNLLDAGDVVSGEIDLYPNPKPEQVVKASIKGICRLAGVEIPAEDIVSILTRLDFKVARNGDELTVTVPPVRGDVDGEADLCEEALRLYGYQHIGATSLRGATTQGKRSERMNHKDRIAQVLQGLGYMEIMNYSFISRKAIEKLGLPADDMRMSPLAIRNPLGEDTAVMRPTLAPDMLKTLSFNMSHLTPEARLYEMAAVFDPSNRTPEGLPTERQTLSIGLYGENADFYELRGVCEAILRAMGVRCEVVTGGDCYYHPGRVARLERKGVIYATLGEVHPDVLAAFELPKRALIAEMDLDAIMRDAVPMGEVTPLPRFPAVARDLALVMDESVAVGPLMQTMKKSAGNLLESIKLFDVYRGLQVGLGRKSVAFSLVFRAPDRTLTDEEIQKAMAKVLKACADTCGAEIR